MDDAPPLEDRLRSALAAGIEATEADAGPPVPDPVDLARRRVAHHRRQIAGRVAAATLLLVVGVGGGWALARSTDGGDIEQVTRPTTTPIPIPSSTAGPDNTDTSPGSSTTTEPPVAPTEDVNPERVPVGPDGLPVVAPVVPDQGTDSGAAARTHSAAGLFVDGSETEYGFHSGSWYPGMPLRTAPLFTRTLDDGTELTVNGNRYDATIYELPPFWAEPAWCFPTGDVEVGLETDGGAGAVRGVRYDAPEPGTVDARIAVVGVPEGRPRWVGLVQAPPDTETVEMEFPGGGSDEAGTVDGFAVLSAPLADGVDVTAEGADGPMRFSVVARAGDGTELTRREGDWTGPAREGLVDPPPYQRAGCAVPETLPAPGPEQPADPAAAESALRAVWDGAFGNPASATVEEQLAAVSDVRGLRGPLEAVKAFISPEVLADTTSAIDDVVFAGPEQAFVHYTISLSIGVYADQFGELVLVDGEWKLTRQTACDLTETGGERCAPLVDG